METKFKILLKCNYCNKTFLRYKCWIKKQNNKHFFCSRKCRGLWQSENSIGEKSFNFKGGEEIRKRFCIICKKLLNRTAYYKGNLKCHSCSRKGKHHSDKIRQKISKSNKGKNHPSYKDGRSFKKYYCKECEKEINWKSFFHGQGRCKSCSRIGKNNPNYIDGRKSLYSSIRGLEEYKNWRNQIFKRDSYTCQECGNNQSNNLNAHHKTEFNKLLQEFLKEYDQFSPIEDKETLVRLAMKWQPFWYIDNGITLCEDCHKIEHSLKFNKIGER